jgi:hypothetical protein
MSKQNINIERLEIRLRGVSADQARVAVSGLGQALLTELSTARTAAGQKRASKIDKLDPGTVQVASGTRPNDLRSVIAGRIAGAIKTKLK